ncbi:hypothetical protein GLYMA_06G214050v4 [Glycine max]|nr:hypothetical protein GLYMA_06G214050v4 [Glycine max]KAH1126985.1 hypothetical protein GYH30_015815 [Glycine max]KAH1127004.1 hypothetical protein GYH30_015832 [Glycine max]
MASPSTTFFQTKACKLSTPLKGTFRRTAEAMAVDRIAAVVHKVAVAKSSVRSARNVATKPQRVTTGPLWLRLATSDPYTLSLDHPSLGHPSFRLVRMVFSFNTVLHHPTLVLRNFFGNMQQPHFANGTTPTPWMPYLPGPHFQNLGPPFGYQPTIPPNNGTTL